MWIGGTEIWALKVDLGPQCLGKTRRIYRVEHGRLLTWAMWTGVLEGTGLSVAVAVIALFMTWLGLRVFHKLGVLYQLLPGLSFLLGPLTFVRLGRAGCT